MSVDRDPATGQFKRFEIAYPVKLNDNYTCQGRDANGVSIYWDDLLNEGDHADEYGGSIVVRRADGLYVERDTRPHCGTPAASRGLASAAEERASFVTPALSMTRASGSRRSPRRGEQVNAAGGGGHRTPPAARRQSGRITSQPESFRISLSSSSPSPRTSAVRPSLIATKSGASLAPAR
jgi:hypothetical protein